MDTMEKCMLPSWDGQKWEERYEEIHSFFIFFRGLLYSSVQTLMKKNSKKELRPFMGREGCVGAILLIVFLLDGLVGESATSPNEVEIEEYLRKLNKPAVKTIMSEDGDIIDCVDIYNQPSFSHPLLKNHTIEMKPSFYPMMEEDNFSFGDEVQQVWQKSGNCPKGTIPIQRTRRIDLLRARSLKNYGKTIEEQNKCIIEFAKAQQLEHGLYLGVKGSLYVWKLQVEANEWSLNSIALLNSQSQSSYLATGWAVSPLFFGDSRTRYHMSWSNDNGEGCLNLKCPGFIQTSKVFVLGAAIQPLSEYGGKQYSITSIIYKDNIQQKWWLVIQGVTVGYWPASLFPKFDSANQAYWGGSVCNSQANGFHTTTQMGSGHFPSEGITKTGVIRGIQLMDSGKRLGSPYSLDFLSSSDSCYKVSDASEPNSTRIFYGGPGGKCCDGRCKD